DGVGATLEWRSRATTGTPPPNDAQGRLPVFLFHRFFDVFCAHLFLLSWLPFEACTIKTRSPGLTALLRVQHSAYRKLRSSCSASVFAVYQRNVPSRRTFTSSSFLSLSR